MKIKARNIRASWKSKATVRLGYDATGHFVQSARELDMTCQINALPFGDYTDTLDDFFGAIFKATMKVAVAGTALYDPRKCDLFKVEQLGFYIRDTYDFNEGDGWMDRTIDPGLGVWSKDRVLNKVETADYLEKLKIVKYAAGKAERISATLYLYEKYRGFVQVRNEDFRDWQKQKNEGGDFFVFSDVFWIPSNVTEILIPL